MDRLFGFARAAGQEFEALQAEVADRLSTELGARSRVRFDPSRATPRADLIEGFGLESLSGDDLDSALDRIGAAMVVCAWLSLPPASDWPLRLSRRFDVCFYSRHPNGCVSLVTPRAG